MSNPYRQAHRLMRRRQGGRWGWLGALVATAVATPLARPVLLSFLDHGKLAAGVGAISIRVSLAIAAVVLLRSYSALVRGPDRAVLDAHPVQPRALLSALFSRLVAELAWLPLAGGVLLSPLWIRGYPLAWWGAFGVVLTGWLSALGVASSVHLAGVWAARSPALARLMDALRGDNPRLQAALIYAPGFGVAVVGLAVGAAASGVEWALGGWTPGWFLLVLPLLVGAAGAAMAGRLADRWYVRATSLLVEIDGLAAGVESAEEARRVYLDWLAQDRPHLLRALRQGWRGLRTWVTGAWGLGLLGALAGWSQAPTAPGRTLAVAGAGVLLIASVAAKLADGDPLWLDRSLGLGRGRTAMARGLAAWLYAQGALIPGVAALLIRQGAAAWPVLGALELLAAVGALLASLAGWRWRGRGVWLYGPVAVLCWALILRGVA